MRGPTRWKTPWTPDGDRPLVVAPFPVLALEIAFIAWVFGFLLYAVATQLELSNATLDGRTMAMLGFFGGALPIFSAYALSTNRRGGRLLSLVTVGGIVFSLAIALDWPGMTARAKLLFTLAASTGFLTIAASLFLLPASRVYYLTLANKPVPDVLMQRVASGDADKPTRLRRLVDRWDVMAVLEALVLVAFLAILIVAISRTNR
ncbi:MAG: hypothetical protein AAFX44_17930 [Pseudomonadota bacterium]